MAPYVNAATAWLCILVSSMILIIASAGLWIADAPGAPLFYGPGLFGFLACIIVAVFDTLSSPDEPESSDAEESSDTLDL